MNIQKVCYLILVFLLIVSVSFSQTTSENYIQAETVLVDSVFTNAGVDSLSNSEKQTLIKYIDGIGRPIQSIIMKGSHQEKDIIIKDH